MAKTKQSAKEFIQSTFPPMVAVMTSPSANEVCLKNKLSFSELLQPFSKVQMESEYFCWSEVFDLLSQSVHFYKYTLGF